MASIIHNIFLSPPLPPSTVAVGPSCEVKPNIFKESSNYLKFIQNTESLIAIVPYQLIIGVEMPHELTINIPKNYDNYHYSPSCHSFPVAHLVLLLFGWLGETFGVPTGSNHYITYNMKTYSQGVSFPPFCQQFVLHSSYLVISSSKKVTNI